MQSVRREELGTTGNNILNMKLNQRKENIMLKDNHAMMMEDKPVIHLTNLLIIMAERNTMAQEGKMREVRADTGKRTTGKEAKKNAMIHTKREIIVMKAKTTTEVETKNTTTTKTTISEITDGTIKTEIDPAKTRLTMMTETTIQVIKKLKKEPQAMKKEQQLLRATYLIDF